MEVNMYTIREMSEKTGLPASTIRYYEEIGLLENVVHKDGYHRMYDDSHLERMAAIECKIADAEQMVGQRQVGKVSAAGKSMISDAGYTTRKR